MPLRNWRVQKGVGEFEEGIQELQRSGRALREAVDELTLYAEPGDFRGLHLTKGVSAVKLAEQGILVAKRKLELSEGTPLFTDPNARFPPQSSQSAASPQADP